MSNELHKVRGAQDNAVGSAKVAAAIRAIDSIGVPSISKKGDGYSARVSGSLRVGVVDAVPGSDTTGDINYISLDDKPVLDGVVDKFNLTSYIGNNFAISSVFGFGVATVKPSLKKGCGIKLYRRLSDEWSVRDDITVIWDLIKSSAIRGFPMRDITDKRTVGDGVHYLKKESTWVDAPVCGVASHKYIGGGFILEGIPLIRLAQYTCDDYDEYNRINGRAPDNYFPSTTIDGSASDAIYRYCMGLYYSKGSEHQVLDKFSIHHARPVSGVWVYRDIRGPAPLVDINNVTKSRARRGDVIFGRRSISTRWAQSPFFSNIAPCGFNGKGFVWGTVAWDVPARADYPWAGAQPPAQERAPNYAGLNPNFTTEQLNYWRNVDATAKLGLVGDEENERLQLAVYTGSTVEAGLIEKKLDAATYKYTRYDASPMFVGGNGVLMLLAGADIDGVEFDEVLPRDNAAQPLEYKFSTKCVTSKPLHWIISRDFGKTWKTQSEPATAGVWCGVPPMVFRNATLDAHNQAMDGIRSSILGPASDKNSVARGDVRRFVSNAMANVYAEYIGKDSNGDEVVAMVIPYSKCELTPPDNYNPQGLPQHLGNEEVLGASSARLFIGPIGNMRQVKWPADEWVNGHVIHKNPSVSAADTRDTGVYGEFVATSPYNDYVSQGVLASVGEYSLVMSYGADGINYKGFNKIPSIGRDTDKPTGSSTSDIFRYTAGVGIIRDRPNICFGNGCMAFLVKKNSNLNNEYILYSHDFGKSWTLKPLPIVGIKRPDRAPPNWVVLKPMKFDKDGKVLQEAKILFRSYLPTYGGYNDFASNHFSTCDGSFDNWEELALGETFRGMAQQNIAKRDGCLIHGGGAAFMAYTGNEWHPLYKPYVNPAFPGEFDGARFS